MVPIIFGVLCVAACAFLIYVLAQFRREFLQLRKSSAGNTRLSEANLGRIEAALKLARAHSYAGEGQQAKHEAVMRKEMLASVFMGLAGLLAPFIFVMLLGSHGR